MGRSMTALFMALSCWACGPTFPTQSDIESELERVLASVAGTWEGSGLGNEVEVRFALSESGLAVEGSGTFRESPESLSIPITVSGTFRRPTLTLALSAFQVGGQSVTGSITGEYVSVAGILTAIELTGGPGGAIAILLQETSP